MLKLSDKLNHLKPSATVKIDQLAKSLMAKGLSLFNLGAGEPQTKTNPDILNGLIQYAQKREAPYGFAGGQPEVCKAISSYYAKELNVHIDSDQIILTNGAKHALFLSFASIINPGDEIIIPSPHWVTYPDLVEWFGGKPVLIQTPTNSFKLTPELLENAISSKSKALVLNSPNNPTGVVYSAEELKELSKLAYKHGLVIISDEIYRNLCYQDRSAPSILQTSPDTLDTCFIVDGLSKSQAAMGWRMGYLICPPGISAKV